MERKQADHKRLNALLGLAEAKRLPPPDAARLLRRDAAPSPAATATSAASGPALFDATEAARKAFSAILRTGESFGAEHLIAILRGDRTEKVLRRGHDRLPTFGVGRDALEGRVAGDLPPADGPRPRPPRPGAARRAAPDRGRPAAAARRDGAGAPRRQRPAARPRGIARRAAGAGRRGGRGAARGAEGEAPRARRRGRRAGLRDLPRPHADRDGDAAAADARRAEPASPASARSSSSGSARTSSRC